VRWLISIADRTHPLVLPGAWVLVGLAAYAAVFAASDSGSCCWDNRTQMWGTALTYSLISGYMLAAITYLYRSHRDTVKTLKPFAPDVRTVDEALADVSPRVILFAAIFGALFGVSQFAMVLAGQYALVPLPDVPLIIGNVVLWAVVAFLTAARLRDALAMRRFSQTLRIDLYNLAALRPIGRAAVRDVLVIMGALALMPLQSLDAEFRWVNYQTGLVLGLISSMVFFFLPMSGVHGRIRAAKVARIDELQGLIDDQDEKDVVALEALVAHRERIAHLPTWPADLSVLSRVGFYLIIPPLAWVGAALVETLVQGYIE
jgi:hypothetical protein